jgi:hypothetical protein
MLLCKRRDMWIIRSFNRAGRWKLRHRLISSNVADPKQIDSAQMHIPLDLGPLQLNRIVNWPSPQT